jgi:hypothetical protein
MAKRAVSANEILADIKAGMNDGALMRRYGLSAPGLQSVFAKLFKAGALTGSELERRRPSGEQTVEVVFKCPSCGKPQIKEFDLCPECGVIPEPQQTKP